MPQNTAKTLIVTRILSTDTRKDSANNVPPIGVKNKGVKHDIPQIPTFFHNFTANLVRRENSFAGVFLYFCIKLRTLVPITKTLITVSIIPKMVQTAVSHHVNSNNSPAIGPLKNLIEVATITVKYFPMAIAK